VSFKFPEGMKTEGAACVLFGESSTNTFVENIGTINRFRVDISDIGAVKNAKAIQFAGIKGGVFPWLDVVGTEAESAGKVVGTEVPPIFFACNGGSEKLVPTALDIGLITVAKAKIPGGGAVQFTSGRDIHIGAMRSEGGICARVETDFTEPASEAERRGVENLRIDFMTCEKGEAAFSAIAHKNFIKGLHIGTAVSRACGQWAFYGPPGSGEGVEMGITVESGECDGTGGPKGKEIGAAQSESIEGLFVPSIEAKDFISPFYIGSFYVKNVENGVRGFPNLHIGCLDLGH
jgi:hypothetical protein